MLTSLPNTKEMNRLYTGDKSYVPNVTLVLPHKQGTDWARTYPYIEIVQMTGGPSAVIRGTRVPVSVIAGYLSMGETAQTIVDKILTHLTLAQVRDAIQYYYDHRVEIDHEREENTEIVAQQNLKKSLGDNKYRQITGA
jgi:uncharacterized protein (DUF433 family)